MKKFDELHVFDSSYKKLEEMGNKRRVDLSILEEVDLLMKRFKELEIFWTENKKAKVEDAFIMYHCARNCSNVLARMRGHFLEAEKKHLNPSVVREAQQILPTLSSLYSIVILPLEKPLNKEQQTHITQRLRDMRNIASSLSLLPTFQEETKDINLIQLRRRFRGLAESLQASYFEE